MSALSPMPQDRPSSIEAFCDQLLAGLGSVREGRRSLEQMVGELSDDERAADGIEPSTYEDDTIEVDPALGWAGTRWSHARDYAMHAISALTCGAFSFLLMQTAGVAALPGLVIAAIAIGAAAGLAPQIGSAISAVGFLVLMANATMQAQGILSMLPVAVIFAAAMSGWWIAWGRTEAAASAALTCALALGCLTGNTFLAAGVAAGVASFWLGPASAAAATGMGVLFARLATVALSAGGVLGLGNVAAALEDPLLWAGRDNCRGVICAAQCPCQACRPGLKPCRNRRHRRHRHRLRSGILSCTPYGNCQPCSRGRRQGGSCGNPILYNRWDMPIFARIPKNLYGE